MYVCKSVHTAVLINTRGKLKIYGKKGGAIKTEEKHEFIQKKNVGERFAQKTSPYIKHLFNKSNVYSYLNTYTPFCNISSLLKFVYVSIYTPKINTYI